MRVLVLLIPALLVAGCRANVSGLGTGSTASASSGGTTGGSSTNTSAGATSTGGSGSTSGGSTGSTGSTGGSGGSTGGPPDAGLFLGGMFPLGVFSQPISSFAKWRGRGINTLVQAELERSGGVPTVSLADWSAAAVDAGLYVIREPRGSLPDDPDGSIASDALDPSVLAWAHPDEPDLKIGTTPASDLQARYAAWKAAAPERPVWINFSGFALVGTNGQTSSDPCNGPGDGVNEGCYPALIAASDWVADDNYPIAGYYPVQPVALVGQTLDKLAGWSGDRPRFAFVETSDQDPPWINTGGTHRSRGPTPAELRAEIWDAVIHGARGVFYFPDRPFGSFTWDATPADVAAELTAQNATLTALAGVLQGPIDPAEASVAVAPPLEAAWRVAGGQTWAFVLNLSPDAGSFPVSLPGAASAEVYGEGRSLAAPGGQLTDAFEGYGVHIYRASARALDAGPADAGPPDAGPAGCASDLDCPCGTVCAGGACVDGCVATCPNPADGRTCTCRGGILDVDGRTGAQWPAQDVILRRRPFTAADDGTELALRNYAIHDSVDMKGVHVTTCFGLPDGGNWSFARVALQCLEVSNVNRDDAGAAVGLHLDFIKVDGCSPQSHTTDVLLQDVDVHDGNVYSLIDDAQYGTVTLRRVRHERTGAGLQIGLPPGHPGSIGEVRVEDSPDLHVVLLGGTFPVYVSGSPGFSGAQGATARVIYQDAASCPTGRALYCNECCIGPGQACALPASGGFCFPDGGHS